jgi:hypothetical protein
MISQITKSDSDATTSVLLIKNKGNKNCGKCFPDPGYGMRIAFFYLN